MKYKDLLKGIVIGMFVAAMAFNLGQCPRQAEAAEQAKDWKQCGTRLLIANPTGDTLYSYNLFWLDHDIKEYKGRSVPRCGGEVKPLKYNDLSKNFRLCLGRHVMVWYKEGESKPTIQKFTVTPDIKSIVLTPDGVFAKFNLFYKPLEEEGV